MAMETGTSVLYEEETVTRTRVSPRWRIIGLNDDVTPMDYVVMVLEEVYNKPSDVAFKLMMEVHETGSAVFYIGTKEACELKVEQTEASNKKHDRKLRVRMEPEEE